MNDLSPQLTLIIKDGCHLCESMLDEIEVLQQRYDFSLNVVDILGDQSLMAQYGTLIPVLMLNNREICRYVLDPVKLKQALDSDIQDEKHT